MKHPMELLVDLGPTSDTPSRSATCELCLCLHPQRTPVFPPLLAGSVAKFFSLLRRSVYCAFRLLTSRNVQTAPCGLPSIFLTVMSAILDVGESDRG